MGDILQICCILSNKFKMKFLCVLVFIAIAATQTSGLSISQPLTGVCTFDPFNCDPVVGASSTSTCFSNPITIQPVGGCTYTPRNTFGCSRRVRRRSRCYSRRSYGDAQLQSTTVKLKPNLINKQINNKKLTNYNF